MRTFTEAGGRKLIERSDGGLEVWTKRPADWRWRCTIITAEELKRHRSGRETATFTREDVDLLRRMQYVEHRLDVTQSAAMDDLADRVEARSPPREEGAG